LYTAFFFFICSRFSNAKKGGDVEVCEAAAAAAEGSSLEQLNSAFVFVSGYYFICAL
jgi:hypothetical protein